MNTAELLEKIKKGIRALLMSAPRGVPARLFMIDYRKVIGKELPFRSLGFERVDDFIRSVPDVIRVQPGPTGEPTLFAVATAETSQIARFVAVQKKPKLKKSLMPPATTLPARGMKLSGFSNNSFSRSRTRTRSRGNRGGTSGNNSFSKKRSYIPPKSQVTSYHTTRPPAPSYSALNPPSSSNRSLVSPRKGRLSSTPSINSLDERLSAPPRSASVEPRSFVGSMWKEEYRQAPVMAISELKSKISFDLKIICIKGYICTAYREDKVNHSGIKYLLYSDMYPQSKVKADGRGVFPAVMLYFKASNWSKQEHPELFTIPVDSHIVAYGKPFEQISAKHSGKREAALTVYYYEVLSRGPSPSPHSFRTVAQPSTKMGSKVTTKSVRSIDDAIIELLRQYSNGLHLRSIKKMFEQYFSALAPPNITDLARTVPGVIIDGEILYLNATVTKARSVVQATPMETRERTPTAGIVSNSLKQKIYELLEEKPNGVYVMQLGKVYSIKYKIDPPKDLANITKTLDFVQYEEDIPGHPVVYLRADARPPTPTEVVKAALTLPSTVEFGSDKELFEVTVSYINSVTSFYVQLLGAQHSEEFQLVVNHMNDYLNKEAHQSKQPVTANQMYGYLWDDGGGDRLWCRALVSSVINNKAHVVFPDYGNSDLVSVATLKELPAKYWDLPFQAVHCCLHGLTDDDDTNSRFNELATDLLCTAHIMDSSGTRVSLELMGSDPSVHETINSILLKALHPISTLEPKLPEPGEPLVPVKLVDIDLDGLVVLQIEGPGFNQLQALMTLINETYVDKGAGSCEGVSDVEEGMLCCGWYDDRWYRVEITRVLSDEEVMVHYVDYGNDEDILISDLRPPIKNELFSLPQQAVKCSLHGVPPEGGHWTYDATNLLWDKEKNLNVSVVHRGSADSLPSVVLTLYSDGSELNLNQWLLEQNVFFEHGSLENEYAAGMSADSASFSSLGSGRGLNSAVETIPSTATYPLDSDEFSSALSTSSETTALNTICETVSGLSLQDTSNVLENGSDDIRSPVSRSSSLISPHSPSSSTPSQEALSIPRTPQSTPSPHLPTQGTPSQLPPTHSTSLTPSTLLSSHSTDLIIQSTSLKLKELTMVTLSWAESPSNFVVQVADNLEPLEKMMESLNCIIGEETVTMPPSLSQGVLYCTMAAVDERWYRVVIVEQGSDPSTVVVEFVDYGGQEEVRLDSLRALPQEFDSTSLPIQGIHCRLHGIKPTGSTWSSQAMEFFEGFMEKQYFIYCQEYTGNLASIILFKDNDQVNTEMVEKRLASQEQLNF